jgi:hypothetical protein
MSRTTGTSILVFGIVLGVVGAIMAWAVTAKADGFDINSAGLILFWVGVATAVVGLVLTFMGNRSTTASTVRTCSTRKSTARSRGSSAPPGRSRRRVADGSCRSATLAPWDDSTGRSR